MNYKDLYEKLREISEKITQLDENCDNLKLKIADDIIINNETYDKEIFEVVQSKITKVLYDFDHKIINSIKTKI